jgi:hypothetical protein
MRSYFKYLFSSDDTIPKRMLNKWKRRKVQTEISNYDDDQINGNKKSIDFVIVVIIEHLDKEIFGYSSKNNFKKLKEKYDGCCLNEDDFNFNYNDNNS